MVSSSVRTVRRTRARQRNIDFAQQAAAPAQREVRVKLFALDRHGRLPRATCEATLCDPDRSWWAQTRHASRSLPSARIASRSSAVSVRGPRMFTTRELRLGRLQLPQSILPLGLETARDRAVIGIDRTITALGALGAVARTFNVSPELRHGGLVIGFELLGGLYRGFEARRVRARRGTPRRPPHRSARRRRSGSTRRGR